MGDGDLDIRGGGIVAVDTTSLREAAAALERLGLDAEAVRGLLARTEHTLTHAGVWILPPGAQAQQVADHARRLARDLGTMADTYEFVELSAAAEIAAAAGDAELAQQLRARAAGLAAHDPGLTLRLAVELARWRTETGAALTEQYTVTTGLPGLDTGALGWALALGVATARLGTLARGAHLTGQAPPVSVRQLRPAAATYAPRTLAAVAARIPTSEARVRVERYAMPDGSRRFVAYIGGTDPSGDDTEAWDGDSNLRLYTAQQSASSEAVRQALSASGAQPGDVVDLVAYSQGGMVASYLATSGGYEVPLLVTLGDPVQADVGPGTLSVALRHLDDPVAALADGGFAGVVGAEGSFVATREVPGTLAGGDGFFAPHDLAAYRDSAAMLDASSDPRMDAVRDRLGELAGATSVQVSEYGASRADAAPPAAPPAAAGGGLSGGGRAAVAG